MERTHVVMVPGFGGFDSLGSIKYYVGVTDVFAKWKGGRPIGLHYFDNLPTSSVLARARELRTYLAKRVARGEFASGDAVCLIGHSTGGLDIRQLVALLHDAREPSVIVVDGGTAVEAKDIVALIRRVVFLSVPQKGTNIADTIEPLVDSFFRRPAFELMGVSVVRHLVERLAGKLDGDTRRPDLFEALDTVQAEIGEEASEDESAAARARHTAADVSLWYSNVSADFLAIRDLAVGGRDARLVTPGAVDATLEHWKGKIATRSYATMSPSPFGSDVAHGKQVRALGEVLRLASHATVNTDAVYRAAYAACSAGPFGSTLRGAKWLREDGNVEPARDVAPWENDGIVNTASTEWPPGAPVYLVRGDHGDIIGHHHRTTTGKTSADGIHGSYDLLRSNAGFTNAYFETVWRNVFDFALTG